MGKRILTGGGSFGTALTKASAAVHPEVQAQILLYEDKDLESWLAKKGLSDFFQQLAPDPCLLPDNISCLKAEDFQGPPPDLFISAYPVQKTREAVQRLLSFRPDVFDHCDILVVSKGMEIGTRKLPCEIVEETASFVKNIRERVCYLIGPNLAYELFRGDPMLANIGGNRKACRRIIEFFSGSNLTLRPTEGRRGLELAGGIKNVHALGAGMLSMLIPSCSTQASFTSICTEEQRNLIYACDRKARKHHALRYGPRGDDMLSLVSGKTRNFRAGKVLVEKHEEYLAGKSLSELLGNQVIEGELAAAPLLEFAREQRVSTPALRFITEVLQRKLSPQEAVAAMIEKGQKWMAQGDKRAGNFLHKFRLKIGF